MLVGGGAGQEADGARCTGEEPGRREDAGQESTARTLGLPGAAQGCSSSSTSHAGSMGCGTRDAMEHLVEDTASREGGQSPPPFSTGRGAVARGGTVASVSQAPSLRGHTREPGGLCVHGRHLRAQSCLDLAGLLGVTWQLPRGSEPRFPHLQEAFHKQHRGAASSRRSPPRGTAWPRGQQAPAPHTQQGHGWTEGLGSA